MLCIFVCSVEQELVEEPGDVGYLVLRKLKLADKEVSKSISWNLGLLYEIIKLLYVV